MKKIVVPVIVISGIVAAFMVGTASSNTRIATAPSPTPEPAALMTTTSTTTPTPVIYTAPVVAPKTVASQPAKRAVVPVPAPVASIVVQTTQTAPVPTSTTSTTTTTSIKPVPIVPACLIVPNTGSAFNLAGMTVTEVQVVTSYVTQVSQKLLPSPIGPFVQRSPCVPVYPEECPEVLTWLSLNSGSGQYVNDVTFKSVVLDGRTYPMQGVQTIADVATRVQEYVNFLKTVQQPFVDTTCRNRIG